MDPPKYINRELSWLEFNQRVLDEVYDESNPLLERLKFLAITASNLDEFFMVRVGGLQMLDRQGSRKCDPSGMTPAEQLDAIGRRAHQMVDDQYSYYRKVLRPALEKAGIKQIRPFQLNRTQAKHAEQYFEEELFCLYSPIAIHSPTEFPFLRNQTLSLCVQLEPDKKSSAKQPHVDGSHGYCAYRFSEYNTDGQQCRFAIIPLGSLDNRYVPIQSGDRFQYLLAEDVVSMFADRFFPEERVVQCVPFRITRNADLSVREDMAADLLAEMESVLDARKTGDCVRLEISERASQDVRGFLQSALEVSDDDIYATRGPLDLTAMMELSGLNGFDQLKCEPWPAHPSEILDGDGSIFDEIRKQDIFLSLPYDSFEPVIRLIDEAADDPDVLSIKIILYRTSRKSPIVAALARAAEHGKHVTALVELKARFDEARNIEWAKALEQAGVHVIYGVKGLKTHAKVCVVVRREQHRIQRYVHFGTGNYNEVTARLYSDFGLLTCDRVLATDAVSFFNAISGNSQPQPFRKISAAPIGLRERLIELIGWETQQARLGKQAHIMAQLNSLAHPEVIEALYDASRAGVRIDLNIRGICCLRPGVRDLSENIRAVSVLDRYLEHSRIIYFYHGGDEQVFISSADWMPRNLDRRVELLVPVEDLAGRAQLIKILQSYSRDNVKGRRLLSTGGYQPPHPDQLPNSQRHRHQQFLYQLAGGENRNCPKADEEVDPSSVNDTDSPRAKVAEDWPSVPVEEAV